MKSSVLSRDLKDASEMLGCFSSGAKEFQNFGPETAKLRGPICSFAQFVSREQSNHHEQPIAAGDNCMDQN